MQSGGDSWGLARTAPVRHTVVVSRAASHSSSGDGMIRLASPAYRTLKLRPSLARAE